MDEMELSENERALARDLRALREDRVEWVAPPKGMWDAIVTQVDPPDSPAAPGREPDAPVTDLSTRRAGGGLSRRALFTAAGGGIAAGLVLGIAGGALLQGDTAPLLSADLTTLDTGERLGSAAIVRSGGQLFLTITDARLPDNPAGYVEAWLINVDGTRMVSVGVYAPVSGHRFPVPQRLLDDGFVLVDLSREPLDGDNNHSGDSIVRGRLQ